MLSPHAHRFQSGGELGEGRDALDVLYDTFPAGIVEASPPDAEYEETLKRARAGSAAIPAGREVSSEA